MFELIRKYKRLGDTLGILTKIDLMKNQSQYRISEILSRKRYSLNFEWIAVKLRSYNDIKKGITLEQCIQQSYQYCSGNFFNNYAHGLTEIRRGISTIQLEHIKKNIPEIRDDKFISWIK